MQKILKWFSLALMLGVAIFIIFFLISINSNKTFIEAKPISYKDKVQNTKLEQVWINHFSNTKRLGYFYPVNEVYLKVDLKEKITKTITYRLSAPILDPYQLFCLKEELKRHTLKYFLKKNKTRVELLIFSKNRNKLKSLIKILKNYQISAIIKPYKKEI